VRETEDRKISGLSCFCAVRLCPSETYWAMPHAARGRDGRQEGRERGYYYLHRNLLTAPPFTHSSVV
jgi:hypothetical protein